MLAGKELEGKIGNVGDYSVDLDMKGTVTADAKAEKAVGQFLTVKGSLTVQADVVGMILAKYKTSTNPLIKGMAEKLSLLTGRSL